MRSKDWKRNAMNLWWHCHGAWWWWASGVWEASELCPTLRVIPGSPLAFHRRWTSELPQVALTHQCASACVSPTAEVCTESAADGQECVKVCACMYDRVLQGTKGIWDNAFSVSRRTMWSGEGFPSRPLKHALFASAQPTALTRNTGSRARAPTARCACVFMLRDLNSPAFLQGYLIEAYFFWPPIAFPEAFMAAHHMLLWNNNKADLGAAAVVNGVEQSGRRIQERYHYIDELNSFPSHGKIRIDKQMLRGPQASTT